MSTQDSSSELVPNADRGNQAAVDRLVSLVYEELHEIAEAHFRRERSDHTLQPTALINEAYARLIDQRKVDWKSRTHFLAIASRQMFRILTDHARAHGAAKRGGGRGRVTLSDIGGNDIAAGGAGSSNARVVQPSPVDFLDLEEALGELRALDPRGCRVVELRYFAGMNVREISDTLDISERTVADDWRTARAWLHARLQSLAESDTKPSAPTQDEEGDASNP